MGILESLFPKKKEPGGEYTNPDLVRAMHEIASNDNPDNRKRFYDALLASMLWVPVPEIPRELGAGLQTTKAPVELQILGITDRNGTRLTPAFTDSEALRNWDPNTPHLAIKAKELFRVVMESDVQGIVINLFDPVRKMNRPGGGVTRVELELLSKGLIPTHIDPRGVQFQLKANEKVFLGRPAHPPSAAIEELLRGTAASFPSIAELYVFQMATQAGSSHTVVGINLSHDVARDQQDEIAKSMSMSVQPEIKPGQPLDFMFLRGSTLDQVRGAGTLIFRKR
jgi:hypothetical protein